MSDQSEQRASSTAIGTGPAAEQRAPAEAGPGAPYAADVAAGPLAQLRTRMLRLLAETDDLERLGVQVCGVLRGWPGVLHAALFHLGDGNLRLEAQHGAPGLDLARVLKRDERLLQSPLRDAFPGLRAAACGEAVLLDASLDAGDPQLAHALRAHGVAMALGLPIASHHSGGQRGSVSLLFDRRSQLAPAQLAALGELAQLAGIGLRMAELERESRGLRTHLTQAATVDALTGVANRRHGEALLEQEVRRARRYGMPLALIGFDIDRLNEVNDHYGHPVGDMALRTVAGVAQELLRSSDVLVRSGGGEFQVIVPHTSALDALKLAEKLRVAIEQRPVPGCDHLTLSFGVAQLEGQESGDALAVRTNAALARAKRGGRNQVQLAVH